MFLTRACNAKLSCDMAYFSSWVPTIKKKPNKQTNKQKKKTKKNTYLTLHQAPCSKHDTAQHYQIDGSYGHTGFSNFVRNSRSLATACCKGKHGTDLPLTLNIFYSVVIFTMSSFLSKYTVLQSFLNMFLHLLFTMTTACHMYLYLEESSKACNSKEKTQRREKNPG
jgi:hypothetical protein